MTDSELKRFVESALHQEVRLRGRDIHVAIEEGNVVLKGALPEIAEMRLAINLVRQLREVGTVKDQLRLFTPTRMTDTQVEQHIRDGWIQDLNIDDKTLQAEVRDGMVTLTGRVDSPEACRIAGLVAWWVPGVANVDNQIRLEPPDQEFTEGDLVDVIRQALDKDVLTNVDTIGVSCQGGVVTLQGYVASEEERQAAEHDCYYIEGVDRVINKLEIVRR